MGRGSAGLAPAPRVALSPGAACPALGCWRGQTRQYRPSETSWCVSLGLVVREGGESRSGAARPRVLLAFHRRPPGGKGQGVLGAGHSGTGAKAAPEVAKLVLAGRVSAGAPLSLMHSGVGGSL